MQKYSELTGQWTTEAFPFTYSEQMFCLAANGKVYAISGFESCWSCTSYVEEYDRGTGALVAKSPIPVACIKAGVAATPDGKIYVCGGCIPVSDGSSAPAYLDTLQVYDTQTGSWSVKKSMPTQRAHLQAVAGSDGRIYVIGGQIKDGAVTDVVEVYEPSTDTWTVKSTMPRKKGIFGAVLIGGNHIYCVGGFTPEMRPDVWQSVDVYDCINDSWSTATPLLQGRWGLAAVVLGTKIYAIGGVLPEWANGTGNDLWFDLVDVGTIA
jgi:N-acetylneuraminic acid mutarotase